MYKLEKTPQDNRSQSVTEACDWAEQSTWSYRQVMSFDLICAVNLSKSFEDVGEDAGVFQVDGLDGSSESLGDELAMLL